MKRNRRVLSKPQLDRALFFAPSRAHRSTFRYAPELFCCVGFASLCVAQPVLLVGAVLGVALWQLMRPVWRVRGGQVRGGELIAALKANRWRA